VNEEKQINPPLFIARRKNYLMKMKINTKAEYANTRNDKFIFFVYFSLFIKSCISVIIPHAL